MRTQSIAGKIVQLSHLSLRLWFPFILAWLRREQAGAVPCVLPGSKRLIQVTLRDFYESYAFFTESKQGRRELSYFLDHLRPHDVIFDIGAFRGAYSVSAKAALGEEVTVHLFEPVKGNLDSLRAVASLNDLQGFKIVEKAVGSGATVKGMLNTEVAMLRQGDSSDALVAVEFPSTTLDDYLSETGVIPTVLKVDVDGFELEVLEGARRCLAEHHPKLWLELHPSYLAVQGKRWEAVIEMLKDLGYSNISFFEDYDLPWREMSFHVWCKR